MAAHTDIELLVYSDYMKTKGQKLKKNLNVFLIPRS